MNREEVSGSADDELLTASTSQSNGDQSPKKGILKRPSLLNDERRDKLFPLAAFRASPDRFPEKGTTRIPKLQVTWWEKNAVAFIGETSDENNTDSEQIMRDLGSGRRDGGTGDKLQIRQTAILDSEDSDMNENEMLAQLQMSPDIDETMSVTSSTGSATSAVVGRWWTGKDTRYVPHCVKKGCNHANHPPPGEYITPTQRRNKELAQLKKELRQALQERDDKDKHLSDLRDKVKEIEIFNETQTTLMEGQKMMRMEQLERESLEKEKKLMERKHAVRVNQLIQETMSAREEAVKLTARNAQLESFVNRTKIDMESQTDCDSTDFYFRGSPPDPSDPNQSVHLISQTIQADVNTPVSPAMSMSMNPITNQMNSPSGSLLIPLVSGDSSNQTIYCSQEALNHIQACQNEAFVWRNKAAQLEIVAKDQLLKLGQLEDELERATKPPTPNPPQSQITVLPNAFLVEDLSNKSGEDESPMSSIVVTGCTYEACVETKNVMKNENDQLRRTFNESKERIGELEDDVNVLRQDLEKADEERARLVASLQSSRDEIESKAAEIVASLNTANRLQQEKVNMQHAIDYMEERMQVYRNTLQENDLVVTDESNADWRKTMTNPRYNVMHSKLVQTVLTSEQLSEHESEFLSTQETLHNLQKDFNAKNSSLADKFVEVEEILLTKTSLVEALTKQLEEIRKDQSKEIKQHQTERDQYKKSLEEVTSIAEKVPLLEAQLAQISKEKNEIDADFKKHVEKHEDELSELLEQSLLKNKSQADYWDEKIKANESMIAKLKADNAGLQKDLEEQKMQAHLQKAELQNKLISSIEHVEQLQVKVNKNQRDVECQAIPRQINKYVGCKPNVKHKETMIEKGALFDENEERLRICKAELETTRRQVTVLQQKLVSFIQQQTSQKVKKRIAVVEDNVDKSNKENLDSKLHEMELKNTELLERVNNLEAEKFVASSMEKSRIQKLVNEFDNLRKKLDQDMSNYSKEKKWLQWRIENLVKDNSELQKASLSANQQGFQRSSESFGVSTFRKAMSEPDIGDETSTEEGPSNENLSPIVEINCPPLAAHSEQPFSQLADVLNLVRSDLEQVLTEIEEPETSKTGINDPSQLSQSQSHISLEQSTNILNDVLNEWEEDQRKQLERQLRRSQEERTVLKSTNNRLSKELQVAQAELTVYRLEKPHKIDQNVVLERSSSFSTFDGTGVEKDVLMWKKKSGTLFREVNRLRNELSDAIQMNNEIRYQLALARGERELSNCMEKDAQYPISPSLSYHTAKDLLMYKEKDEIIVHEPEEPFQLGSSKASLSCSIMIRSQSLERKSQPKESGRRSRSANRKPPASKDELNNREKRRESRLPKNVSRSSSVASMYFTSKENSKLPLMSASWHEKAMTDDLPDGDTDYDRRNVRVVSLREKVGKLLRENKDLQTKLKSQTPGNNNNRSELEKETEELKQTIKELLQRVSQATPQCDRQLKLLQDELAIRRKESAMYEKKLNDIEEERKEMYLVMFKKGQQAANMEIKDEKVMDAMTEDRITLKFLHDAFYYYLLNRGDSQEHLSVIMTMLGFTASQKTEISNRKRGRSN